jgi:MFS family permease
MLPSASSGKSSMRFAWYAVVILTLCYTLSFVDRQILSLLVGPMKRDFGLSDTRIGLLQGLAFASFYTLMGLPLGRLADTRSRRNLIAFGILLWSVMTGLCSAARGFWSLFLARMGVGVGEASLSPAAFSLISDYFPKERLGIALSVYSMGISIGSGLALLVGGLIIESLSRLNAVHLPILGTIAPWRLTFLGVGLPGIVFALLIYSIREPRRQNLLLGPDGQPSRLGLDEVFAQVRVRWQSITGLSLGILCQAIASYAFFAWAPTFFQRVHGWTAGQVGRDLGILVVCCGCLGNCVGGILSDHLQAKGIHEGPLRVGVLAAAGAGLLIGVAMMISNARWSLGLMAPALFFLSLPGGTSYAALQLILPNQVRGQVSALFLMILNIGGLSLGPLLPGVFSDYLFKDERMVGPSVALTMGIACLLVLLVLPATYRPYRRHFQIMHPIGEVATD